MKKFSIDQQKLESITKIAKQGCKLAFYGLATVLSYNLISEANDDMRKIGEKASYSDAIEAIMKSDLIGSYRTQLVEKLDKNADSETYLAVIRILNSDMLGSYRVKSILSICGTEEAD